MFHDRQIHGMTCQPLEEIPSARKIHNAIIRQVGPKFFAPRLLFLYFYLSRGSSTGRGGRVRIVFRDNCLRRVVVSHKKDEAFYCGRWGGGGLTVHPRIRYCIGGSKGGYQGRVTPHSHAVLGGKVPK